MRVGVTGLSPLLVHQWSEKAQRQILERQQKRASAARVLRLGGAGMAW
jgi:Asp/Glu/hydantoin racemase